MARSNVPSGYPERQRGVALIMAVLAVAFATTAAVALNYDTYLALRRTQNLVTQQQALAYARAAEGVAMELLAADRRNNGFDALGDLWARPLPPLTLDDGAVVSVGIEDLQALFNLNTTAAPGEERQRSAQAQLARLLGLTYPEYRTGVEHAVADWIDADNDIRYPDGAEDDSYSRLDTPYRPGNTMMVESAELRLVRGIDQAAWEAVAPYVTALPETSTAINVNTAPAMVLMAMGPDIDLRTAEAVIAARGREPFTDIAGFRAAFPAFADPRLPEDSITVTSQYFLVRAQVILDRARVDSYSVIHRPMQGPMRVVYRSTQRP
jgi:general secretion pathway protein K